MVALTRLIDQLQTNVDYDFVSGRLDTLEMYLLSSLKKGDASEVTLVCRALSLMSITLGAESDRLVSNLKGPLLEFLKNSSKSPSGRAAVAEAIGFVWFIGSSNDQDTLEVMNLLVEQLRLTTLPEAVATACWESFALLASTLPTHKLVGREMTQHLTMLIKYLEHDSIDVKTAAGECIALLWEAKQEVEAEAAAEQPSAAAAAGDDEMAPFGLGEAAVPVASTKSSAVDDDEPMAELDPAFALSGDTRSPAMAPQKRPFLQAAASSSSSSSSTGVVIDEAELIDKFSSLAKDSGRYQSKKVRATQKKSFREFLRTVEVRIITRPTHTPQRRMVCHAAIAIDGVCIVFDLVALLLLVVVCVCVTPSPRMQDGDGPSESLKIEKSRHEFSGWSQIIQLDAIRDVIGKGLNTHFVYNETLREIFDLFIESGDGVDDPQRKAASRAQSKAKERENFEARKKNRQKKNQLANSFGED